MSPVPRNGAERNRNPGPGRFLLAEEGEEEISEKKEKSVLGGRSLGMSKKPEGKK